MQGQGPCRAVVTLSGPGCVKENTAKAACESYDEVAPDKGPCSHMHEEQNGSLARLTDCYDRVVHFESAGIERPCAFRKPRRTLQTMQAHGQGSIPFHCRTSSRGCCLFRAASSDKPLKASSKMTVSGTKSLELSATRPSTPMLKRRTMMAVDTIVATRLTPATRCLAEMRHAKLKIAKPSGNAPNPIRVVVVASAEFSVAPVAAAARTGSEI